MQASLAAPVMTKAAYHRSDFDDLHQPKNPNACAPSSAHFHRRLQTSTLTISRRSWPHLMHSYLFSHLWRRRSTSLPFCPYATISEGDCQTAPLRNHHATSEERVYDVVLKQAALMAKVSNSSPLLIISEQPQDGVDMKRVALNFTPKISSQVLKQAHARCREICADNAKTFYLGTTLMTPERQLAIWAIYVWCRRTDELVDGPNSPHITPAALSRWEQRLEDIFKGRPYDMLDAGLADAVAKFPLNIQPFRDMIEGMRMDLVKTRYNNFDELYLYCYYVAGTVGLMSVPVMGIDARSKATTESVFNAALALGIANQLTNILRDVGEDAGRGRIYLPKDELAEFGLGEEDVFAGKVTDRWRAFMKGQVKRARFFFDEAEKGVIELHKDSRWPVWASLMSYRQILDAIEANDYNNFSKRAYVGKLRKLALLPAAYGRALLSPPTGMSVLAGKR